MDTAAVRGHTMFQKIGRSTKRLPAYELRSGLLRDHGLYSLHYQYFVPRELPCSAMTSGFFRAIGAHISSASSFLSTQAGTQTRTLRWRQNGARGIDCLI